jgi:hypothetical protein
VAYVQRVINTSTGETVRHDVIQYERQVLIREYRPGGDNKDILKKRFAGGTPYEILNARGLCSRQRLAETSTECKFNDAAVIVVLYCYRGE